MSSISNLYLEFVSLAIEGRDPETLNDLVERYEAECVDLIHRMAHLIATTEADLEFKIAMWQDAQDYEIGLPAREQLLNSINDDLARRMRIA